MKVTEKFITGPSTLNKMTYPYILKTSTVKDFFEKIPSLGVPERVIHKFIYSIGFKSTSDRPIISILEFLGFIDSAKVPTNTYRQYRNRDISRKILGDAIRRSYEELFKTYPNAYMQDLGTLRNFFSTHTALGERAVKSIGDTFKTLCSIADFNGEQMQSQPDEKNEVNLDSNKNTTVMHKIDFALSGNRKIQLTIPSDITSKEIERLQNLLEALKKDEA